MLQKNKNKSLGIDNKNYPQKQTRRLAAITWFGMVLSYGILYQKQLIAYQQATGKHEQGSGHTPPCLRCCMCVSVCLVVRSHRNTTRLGLHEMARSSVKQASETCGVQTRQAVRPPCYYHTVGSTTWSCLSHKRKLPDRPSCQGGQRMAFFKVACRSGWFLMSRLWWPLIRPWSNSVRVSPFHC